MIKTLLNFRILTVVAVTSILVGCSGPQPATTVPTSTSPLPTATAPEPYTVVVDPAPVIGSWKYSSSNFTRFDPDGTYREARSLEALDDKPFAINQYDFEGGFLVVREISVSDVPPCGSKVGIYEVRILDSGQMQMVLIKDGCGHRERDTVGIYERIP
jgi:hypothetical protein